MKTKRYPLLQVCLLIMLLVTTLFLAPLPTANASNTARAEGTDAAQGALEVDIEALGGSVRLSDPTGIRFATSIAKADYDELAQSYEIKAGALIIPERVLDGRALELSVSDALDISIDSYVEKDGNYFFNAVLYNIPESEYNTALTSRGYFVFTDKATAAATTVYAEPVTRSIASVAQSAIDDGSYTENAELLQAFVDTAAKYPSVTLLGTASATVADIGTELYVTATDKTDGELSATDKLAITVFNGEGADVTANVYSRYTDPKDPAAEVHHVFKPTAAGEYTVVAEVTNSQGNKNSVGKKITVSTNYDTPVYGWKVFDITNGGDKIVLSKGRLIFMTGIDYNTAKIAPVLEGAYTNWTISFNVTGLTYTATDPVTGKLNLTLWTKNSNNQGGWENIALGGKAGNDLWGFEAETIGTGWVSYQWRSNWQDPITTEFMPDPNDRTVGCGRGAGEYAQYGTGTHNYKIVCSTDAGNNVTYTYYIDGQIEAVHHLPDDHDGYNCFDFLQFQSQYMSGIVSDLSVTAAV